MGNNREGYYDEERVVKVVNAILSEFPPGGAAGRRGSERGATLGKIHQAFALVLVSSHSANFVRPAAK